MLKQIFYTMMCWTDLMMELDLIRIHLNDLAARPVLVYMFRFGFKTVGGCLFLSHGKFKLWSDLSLHHSHIVKPPGPPHAPPRLSALRLLGVDLVLSLQPGQHRPLAATHPAVLRQVLEGALSRPPRTPERLLQSLLVQVGVEAGVLLDGGHAGAVQRRGAVTKAGTRFRAGDWGGAGLQGAARLEAQGASGGRGEAWGFVDTNWRRLQAAEELGILGK